MPTWPARTPRRREPMRSCPNRLPVRSWAHLMKLAPLLAIALATGCSTASHPVSTAEKVAHGTVTLAGKAATSATGTAVQVTKAGVAAAGKVASATTGAVAKVAKTAFVILKEPASGKTKQIPWAQGLTVARARQLAGYFAWVKDVNGELSGATGYGPSDQVDDATRSAGFAGWKKAVERTLNWVE